MFGFILVFHQLICGPNLADKIRDIRKESPEARIYVTDGYGRWALLNCVLVERRINVPTMGFEI